MPEDDARNGLRVGGWIPPYSPGGDSTGPIRPTTGPAPAGGTRSRDGYFSRTGAAGHWRPRIVLAAALCLACAATAAVAVALDAARSPDPIAADFTFPTPLAPFDPAADSQTPTDVPVSIQPSPSATTPTTPPTTRSRRYSPAPATSAVATRTTATTTKPTTPPVSLPAGSTVGLEPVGRPGQRVRHRDYRGRLDTIGANSSAGERADTNFRVRTGLANGDCVSLESVNFPGYYLRHRDFQIRLDRRDRTDLFQQDATFCPVTISQGTALVLRSTNYPTHYVVADGDSLRITRTTAAEALAFTPRPAL